MMIALPAVFAGYFFGGFANLELIRWIMVLSAVRRDHQLARAYPHTGRKQMAWAFPVLIFLHGGPWVLAGLAYAAYELAMNDWPAWVAWFLTGYGINFLLLASTMLRFARQQTQKKGGAHVA